MTFRPFSENSSGIFRIPITFDQNPSITEEEVTFVITFISIQDRIKDSRIQKYEQLLPVSLLLTQQIIRWLIFIMKTDSCCAVTGKR